MRCDNEENVMLKSFRAQMNVWFLISACCFCCKVSAEEAASVLQSVSDSSGPLSAEAAVVSEVGPSTEVDDNSAVFLNRKIDEAEARLSLEPSLAELRQAALAQADAGREASARWKRASRLCALLPTLKVSADFDEGRDESLDRYQDDPDRWGADTDRGFGADVSLQWKLDRLAFNTDELKVYDALADRAERRENISTLLISVYFERRRLQLELLLLPPDDLNDALERRMRIEELGRTIDALTGGLLSRKIKPSKR
jgi:hypothetical protein